MARSPGFGSDGRYYHRLTGVAFARAITMHPPSSCWPNMQKVRCHPTLSRSQWLLWFQLLVEPLVQAFHQFTTCFFNIPSRYSALSVNGAYLALMMVHPSCLNRQGSIKAAWQAANSLGRSRLVKLFRELDPLPKRSKAIPSLGYHHLWLAIPSHFLCLCPKARLLGTLPILLLLRINVSRGCLSSWPDRDSLSTFARHYL
jgi:hypothetical protein